MTTHTAPIPPELAFPKHYLAGGCYAKELWLKEVGWAVESHVHHYDHLSLLVRGQVEVIVDGHSTIYTAPTGINIKAGKAHKIVARRPDTLWYCIHAVPEELRTAEEIDATLGVSSSHYNNVIHANEGEGGQL